MIPILLTATVNPNGMVGANFSVEERAAQYVEAVSFYLKKGMKVVFAENSGSIAAVKRHFADATDVEWVDVSAAPYDQSRGKGYNETIAIHEAIAASKMIREAGCFFKITGRLKLINIAKLLKECSVDNDTRCYDTAGGLRYGQKAYDNDTLRYKYENCEAEQKQKHELRFLADCKDHRVYEWLHMPINGHAGECRYWFATTQFFVEVMWKYHDRLNDYEPNVFLAEDAMLAVCRETRGWAGCHDRFRTQARISGRGGHDLGKGLSFFYSTDNDSWALKVKCALRQLLRYIMPFWRC